MSFAHHMFSMAVAGLAAFWAPSVALAAWDLERSGPHAQHRTDSVPAEEAPKEPRSMAPKPGVAMQRPVAPAPGSPPSGIRSLAPKQGVAFSRPVAPPDSGSGSDMPLAAD